MVKMKYLMGIAFCAALISCSEVKKEFIEENVEFAHKQIGNEIKLIEESGKFMNPTTLNSDGSVYYCNLTDWRSGFFPGSIWYLYELTGDKTLLPIARKYTEEVKDAKNITWNHDVGFMIYCSFGNGLRLIGDEEYKNVIVEAARSLSTRFRPVAGIIQSWNVDRGWISERGWECPVIIDNMMNLELLFAATKLSGDSTFYKIAVSHVDRTMKEQYRPDGSCYHVVDYSMENGSVRFRHTAQGYAHESAWSRGQAWGLYGYTVCYRETGLPEFLEQAKHIENYIFSSPTLPEDLVPYWDFNAPGIPNEPRDASAATVTASALYELSMYDPAKRQDYITKANTILENLSANYRAAAGKDRGFLLLHSTGSKMHNVEVDVSIVYADYYYLEALLRKQKLEKEGTAIL